MIGLGKGDSFSSKYGHFLGIYVGVSLEAYVMQKDEFFATETPREATVTEQMSWALGKELTLHETKIQTLSFMGETTNLLNWSVLAGNSGCHQQ